MANKLTRYTNLKCIGEGSQGQVISGKDNVNSRQVAIKIYDAKNISALNEVRILSRIQKLGLKGSVELYETFLEQNRFFIIMEMIKGEELHNLVTSNDLLPINDVKRLFKQVLTAVNELHENNICHLDLKLENIMVDPKQQEIKLIDFGFAEFTKETADQRNEKMISQFRGSIHYSAPEIVRNIPFDGKKADIWALGVLLYILITKRFPFPGNENDYDDYRAVAQQIVNHQLTFNGPFTPQVISLIELMLQSDPTKRLPIKYLLQHPWLN